MKDGGRFRSGIGWRSFAGTGVCGTRRLQSARSNGAPTVVVVGTKIKARASGRATKLSLVSLSHVRGALQPSVPDFLLHPCGTFSSVVVLGANCRSLTSFGMTIL